MFIVHQPKQMILGELHLKVYLICEQIKDAVIDVFIGGPHYSQIAMVHYISPAEHNCCLCGKMARKQTIVKVQFAF